MQAGEPGEARAGSGPTARQVRITGRVQGVGFRRLVRGVAQAHELVGWVRNLPDGSVEAWLEGERAQVESALARLRNPGPPARVDACAAEERPPQQHARFTLMR